MGGRTAICLLSVLAATLGGCTWDPCADLGGKSVVIPDMGAPGEALMLSSESLPVEYRVIWTGRGFPGDPIQILLGIKPTTGTMTGTQFSATATNRGAACFPSQIPDPLELDKVHTVEGHVVVRPGITSFLFETNALHPRTWVPFELWARAVPGEFVEFTLDRLEE